MEQPTAIIMLKGGVLHVPGFLTNLVSVSGLLEKRGYILAIGQLYTSNDKTDAEIG